MDDTLSIPLFYYISDNIKVMQDINQLIIYEDDYIIAINKPIGLAVQTKENTDSLSTLIAPIYPDFHLINRIDQVASGIVIISKNHAGTKAILPLYNNNKVEKHYTIIVAGHVYPQQGILTNYLTKKNNKAYITNDTKQGKESVLTYNTIRQLNKYTILDVKLETGRFHQIRCQMAHIGHPIKGDLKYGSKRSNPERGIYLHSHKVIFTQYPDKESPLIIQAPLPSMQLWNLTMNQDNISKT